MTDERYAVAEGRMNADSFLTIFQRLTANGAEMIVRRKDGPFETATCEVRFVKPETGEELFVVSDAPATLLAAMNAATSDLAITAFDEGDDERSDAGHE